MSRRILLTAGVEEEDMRVDRYLADTLDGLSRSYIQKILKEGGVTVNGDAAKASLRLQENDQIELILPDDQEMELVPENIPLDILYEDDQLLVVNKPKGMVVHPAPGHYEHTLVHALLYHCGDSLSGINGVLRPGIVHRIDRDTTGALVVCKTDAAHRALAKQLAEHRLRRSYRAILIGRLPDDERTIEANIGRDPRDRKRMSVVPEGHGKSAVTHVSVEERLRGFTFVSCRLETGRTHQIRVHLSHAGFPVLGDTVYGPSRQPVTGLEGQTLHAMELGFLHPVSGEEMLFTAPLPGYFENLLRKLR